MHRIHEEQGLAGIVLVLVVAWALLAVFMLTRTLNAAQQIDTRVGFITHYVSPIDADLDAVKLLEETSASAAGILEAAEPLSGQLAQVQDAAQGINTSVTQILDTAGSINQTVKSINSTVDSINATVESINGNVTSIHSDIAQVERRAPPTLATVRSIDRGVAAINNRAAVIIGLAQGVKADTAGILAETGAGRFGHSHPRGGSNIHGHARSIDCNFVIGVARTVSSILPLSPTQVSPRRGNYCDEVFGN